MYEYHQLSHAPQLLLDPASSCKLTMDQPEPEGNEQRTEAFVSRLRAGTVITEASNCTELLRDHTCFHRSITGSEAEERLRTSGYNHCYLTRFSKQHKCYMLTVYQFQIPKHVVEHYKISLNSGKCCLDGKDDLFNDIDELLHHCETHPISPSFVHVGRKYTQEEYRNRRVREQEELRARENEENRAREEVDHGEGCQGQPAKRCSMM